MFSCVHLQMDDLHFPGVKVKWHEATGQKAVWLLWTINASQLDWSISWQRSATHQSAERAMRRCPFSSPLAVHRLTRMGVWGWGDSAGKQPFFLTPCNLRIGVHWWVRFAFTENFHCGIWIETCNGENQCRNMNVFKRRSLFCTVMLPGFRTYVCCHSTVKVMAGENISQL